MAVETNREERAGVKSPRKVILAAALVLALPVSAWAGVPFLRGDANGDGTHDVSDPVTILRWLFSGSQPSVPLDALDVNDDGSIDVSDAVYNLSFLFTGGPPPHEPSSEPGFDPTPDDPYTEGDEILPGEWIPKPDLAPTALFLDADNVLHVTLASEGEVELPEGTGTVAVHVDGRLARRYRLPDITEPSFRSPGSTHTVRTDLRLGGENRRLSVFVDADHEILEANEMQNTISRTVTPEAKPEADLVVADLQLEEDGRLRVVVENIGAASSPEDLPVRLNISISGSPTTEHPVTLPSLDARGGNIAITPSLPAPVIVDSRVRVLLEAESPLAEGDNTNNGLERVLPDGPDLEPYRALLESPRIRASVVWEGSEGVASYGAWGESQTDDLLTTLRKLEEGEPGPLAEPPALVAGNSISATDAWWIYLAHVAQSLWVEARRAVSWRLENLSDTQLAYLLDSRKLVKYSRGADTYRFDISLLGNVTAWNPRIAYEFLSNFELIRATQLGTIHALTDWMRGHLIHTSGADVFTELFGYAGPPPVDKVLYALEGRRHKTAGCWGTTGLYAAVLRSVNIPVKSEQTVLTCCNHSRPEFPSVDRSMPHGDNPYTAVLLPSGAVIPSSALLYTSEEMNAMFLEPPVDCVNGTCNTSGEQASYNMGKDLRQIAFDYMGDYLLYDFTQYGAAHLDDTLRGSRVGGEIQEFARPFFTEEERALMVQAVEARIEEIGGGDLEAGKRAVRVRYGRFGSRK